MSQILLDPTGELGAAGRQRVPPPASLEGLTVGLLDITKRKGDVFLDRLGERLRGEGAEVRRFNKLTFAKPAAPEVGQQIAEACDVVVEALAD